jgi:hypothetical protein
MQTITDPTFSSLEATAGPAAVDANVAQAIALIDGSLTTMMKRELVATGEVVDLLLDVRSLLAESIPSAN